MLWVLVMEATRIDGCLHDEFAVKFPLIRTPRASCPPVFFVFSHPWHDPSMACVAPRNANPFSLLDSLNPPPPNELTQILPQRNPLRKGTTRDPTPVPAKLGPQNTDQRDLQRQRNPHHRQTKPGFADVRAPLLDLRLTHPYICPRHQVESKTLVDPTITPPHYLPDCKTYKTIQSSREYHQIGYVAQRLGETFHSLSKEQPC